MCIAYMFMRHRRVDNSKGIAKKTGPKWSVSYLYSCKSAAPPRFTKNLGATHVPSSCSPILSNVDFSEDSSSLMTFEVFFSSPCFCHELGPGPHLSLLDYCSSPFPVFILCHPPVQPPHHRKINIACLKNNFKI